MMQNIHRFFMICLIKCLFILAFINTLFSAELPNGRVLYLDGDGDFVKFYEPLIRTKTFTIECWAYMLGQGGGELQQNPVFMQRTKETGPGNPGISMFTQEQYNSCRFSIRGSASFGLGYALRYPQLPYFEWHHYAGVAGPDSVYFYVDGICVKVVENREVGDFFTNATIFDFGRNHYLGSDKSFFYGFIDEMRLWNYPKNKNEILQSYLCTVDSTMVADPDAGLCGYWTFDNYDTLYIDDHLVRGVIDKSSSKFVSRLMGDAKLAPSSPQNVALQPFLLDYPPFDATIYANTDTLRWSAATAEKIFYPQELVYTLWLSTDDDFENAVEFHVQRDTFKIIDQLENGKTYFWHVCAKNIAGDSLCSTNTGAFFVSHQVTGLGRTANSRRYIILENYPNPFNPSTTIQFELPQPGTVSLKIYDIQGRVVNDAGTEFLAAGQHNRMWNGENTAGEQVAAGVYFYRVEYQSQSGQKQVMMKKMSLVR